MSGQKNVQKHSKEGKQWIDEAHYLEYVAEYIEKRVWLSTHFQEVTPIEYYRDMFEDHLSVCGDMDVHRPNGIVSIISKEKKQKNFNCLLWDDLQAIEDNMEHPFVLVAPIGFSGKKRQAKFAYSIYGMIFDLDNVNVNNLEQLLHQMSADVKRIPYPTYIVNSGTGVHVVYLFEEPIPALEKYFSGLNKLKAELSELIWNKRTSREDKKQYQGIFQAYRMVGMQSSPHQISLLKPQQPFRP